MWSPFGAHPSTRAGILAFDTVGILDLIVSLANDIEQNRFIVFYLMEIVVYLLRGQTVAGLLATDEVEGAENDDEEARRDASESAQNLKKQLQKELRIDEMNKQYRRVRHSRFGGAFEIKQLAGAKPKFHNKGLRAGGDFDLQSRLMNLAEAIPF